jgi:hypothetical protein
MKTLTAICLAFILAIGSIITIPATPANGWILPLLFRAAAMNAAKQEFRTLRAKCKSQPKTCRPTTKRLTQWKSRSKSRLRATSKKSKSQYHRPRHY